MPRFVTCTFSYIANFRQGKKVQEDYGSWPIPFRS